MFFLKIIEVPYRTNIANTIIIDTPFYAIHFFKKKSNAVENLKMKSNKHGVVFE